MRPKVICQAPGLPGWKHRRLPFGSVRPREFSVRATKNLVHQDPDTQNEAVHLVAEQRAT